MNKSRYFEYLGDKKENLRGPPEVKSYFRNDSSDTIVNKANKRAVMCME